MVLRPYIQDDMNLIFESQFMFELEDWAQLVKDQPEAECKFLKEFYLRVIHIYKDNCLAVPLYVVGRSMGKRYNKLPISAKISMGTLVKIACMTDSLQMSIKSGVNGQMLLLPKVVLEQILSDTVTYADMVDHLDVIMMAKMRGPIIQVPFLKAALMRLDNVYVPTPQAEAKPAENRHSVEKIDDVLGVPDFAFLSGEKQQEEPS